MCYRWRQFLLIVCVLSLSVCKSAAFHEHGSRPLRGISLRYPAVSMLPNDEILPRKNTLLYGSRAYNSRSPSGGRRPKKSSRISRKRHTGAAGLGLVGATGFLLGANVLMYVITKGIPGLGWLGFRGSEDIFRRLIKFDYFISQGELYRFATSLFLHGSIQHLFFNSYSLTSIGPQAEQMFGSARFIAAYIFSGVMANCITYLGGGSPASLGASGCIFGTIGAFAMFYFRNKDLLGQRAEMGLQSIKRTLFINFMYSGMSPGIDHAAHAYGFIAGAFFSYLFGPRLSLKKESGYSKVIDRPLIPYIKHWKRLKNLFPFTDSGKSVDVTSDISGRDGSSYGNRNNGRYFSPRRSGLDF